MKDIESTSVPVLLLGFNRPDKMRRVIEPLRQIQPRRVFISVDGPRDDHPDDIMKCQETQRIAEQLIDWKCNIQKLYREHNLGCRRAVSGAITWALEQVDEIVVIEDDCIVDPNFFVMCRVLLDRHRADTSVACIAGTNFQSGIQRGDGDYYASKYPHCWGWATWRRAWSHYVDDLATLQSFVESKDFDRCHATEMEREYWRYVFGRCKAGEVDSWAYRWTFSCWLQKAVTLLPNVNMVTNIGFGTDATHTKAGGSADDQARQSLKDFRRPSSLAADLEADRHTFEHVFCPVGSPTENIILNRRLHGIRSELKDLKKENDEHWKDATGIKRWQSWARSHPVKAAWRVLRGRIDL